MKTIEEVLAAFEMAALKAGLRRNTRRTYAGAIGEFSRLLKSQQIDGVQGYLDRVVIPFPKSA